MTVYKEIRLHDNMPFGQHKDKTLKEVIDTDIDYITWLIVHTPQRLQQGSFGYYTYKIKNQKK